VKLETVIFREARKALGRPARVHYYYPDKEAVEVVVNVASKHGLNEPVGFRSSRASLRVLAAHIVACNGGTR